MYCSPSSPIPPPRAPSFTTGFGSLPNSLEWPSLDDSTNRLRNGLDGIPNRLTALAAGTLRIRRGRQGEEYDYD
jgi:hypothetical protein